MANAVLTQNAGYIQPVKSESYNYMMLKSLQLQINSNLESLQTNLETIIEVFNQFVTDKYPDETDLILDIDNLPEIDVDEVYETWKESRDEEDIKETLLYRLRQLEADVETIEQGLDI